MLVTPQVAFLCNKYCVETIYKCFEKLSIISHNFKKFKETHFIHYKIVTSLHILTYYNSVMFEKAQDVEVVKHGMISILRLNYLGKDDFPSISDSSAVMRDTIKKITQNPSISKVLFIHNKNYEHSFEQVKLLKEIGEVYTKLTHEKELFMPLDVVKQEVSDENSKLFFERYSYLQNIIIKDILADPIGTYVKLKRKLRDYKFETTYIQLNMLDERYEKAISYMISLLETTTLLKKTKHTLSGHNVGSRKIYRPFFVPNIKPNFVFTSLQRKIPIDAQEIDSYSIQGGSVKVLEMDNDAFNLYHLTPIEFTLSEEKYQILNLAKEVLSEHAPESSDFISPERLREVFYNISKDLVEEIATFKHITLTQKEIDELAQVLIRYTIGFGLVETLLSDENVQDISINAPANRTPIFLTHSSAEDCKTNIIPEEDEVEGWASRLRMISGKPLDASNPLLDTEIETPTARARVSVISKPLNPYGLGFSFRRHRDKPWTLLLFIQNRTISSLAAGVLSFIIDGARTILIAGTRGSGKSSILSALLVEIMRKYRIITVEDSVVGESELLYTFNKETKKECIENVFNELSKIFECKKQGTREIISTQGVNVLSMNTKGSVELKESTTFIRHRVNKKIYSIVTRSGREISLTQDHSLFTIDSSNIYKEVKPEDLSIKDVIVVPNTLPISNREKKYIDIVTYLAQSQINTKNIFVKVKDLKEKDLDVNKDVTKKKIPSRQTIRRWITTKSLPFQFLKEKSYSKITHIKYSSNSHKYIPSKIVLHSKILSAIGLFIADGCYDAKSIIFSVSSKEEQKLVKDIAKEFNISPKIHSDRFSMIIHSRTLRWVFIEIFKLIGNAYTKQLPAWLFSLSKKQLAMVLKGLFSGDGCVGKYEIIMSLASKQLLKDTQTALLYFGIQSRLNLYQDKKGTLYPDRTNDLRISSLENVKAFYEKISFLQEYKKDSLRLLTIRSSTHSNTNSVPLPDSIKKKLSKCCPKEVFNSNDYIKRNNSIGREKLKKVVAYLKSQYLKSQYLKTQLSQDEENKNKKSVISKQCIQYLECHIRSDILWDEIKKITYEKKEEYVYDISVPKNENFIVNNVLAHNTLEIPTLQFNELGYNIQAMSVKSALSLSSEGYSADMGIRSTLRLGDSCLIVGEVRSTEALALYEAMRVGALANVVAGTIHGDSPYGVYDRLVNDLKVPKTSFKATDVVIVANPVKSSDGLHRNRRVTQIAEVRKNWEEDPLLEGGFCDLFKYNATTDMLEISDDLLNGESDLLKSIGANVKQWAGNWDAIWDNIELRAKVKEFQVQVSQELKCNELLEAKSAILANDQFHKISQKINDEMGRLDSKRIYQEFEMWYRGYAKHVMEELK